MFCVYLGQSRCFWGGFVALFSVFLYCWVESLMQGLAQVVSFYGLMSFFVSIVYGCRVGCSWASQVIK